MDKKILPFKKKSVSIWSYEDKKRIILTTSYLLSQLYSPDMLVAIFDYIACEESEILLEADDEFFAVLVSSPFIQSFDYLSDLETQGNIEEIRRLTYEYIDFIRLAMKQAKLEREEETE